MPALRVNASSARSGLLPMRMSKKLRRACRWTPVFGPVARNKAGYVYWWKKGAGYVPVHRLIVGSVLGRQLRKYEQVHHIDGRKDNNQKWNLLVCHKNYHRWLHKRCLEVYGSWHLPGRIHARRSA